MKLELRYPDPSGTTAENENFIIMDGILLLWSVDEEGLKKQAQ